MLQTTDASETDLALARAGMWKLLGLAFRAPDSETARELAACFAGIDCLLDAASLGDSRSRAVELATQLESEALDLARRARDYAACIGHTPRAGAIPYETEWTGCAGELRQLHQISDLAAFYRAVGLELAPRVGERADHVSIQASFMQFLCSKEAWAREQGDLELAGAVVGLQARFLGEHLNRWAPAFCRRLTRRDSAGFLGAAAELFGLWLRREAARFGCQPGDPTLEPGTSSLTIEDTCVSCLQSSTCTLRPVSSLPVSSRKG